MKELVESGDTLCAATGSVIAWFDGYRWRVALVAGLDPQGFTDMALEVAHRVGEVMRA